MLKFTTCMYALQAPINHKLTTEHDMHALSPNYFLIYFSKIPPSFLMGSDLQDNTGQNLLNGYTRRTLLISYFYQYGNGKSYHIVSLHSMYSRSSACCGLMSSCKASARLACFVRMHRLHTACCEPISKHP